MAGSLFSLLDDVAAIAKLAAASIDDVGAAASKAGAKAVGVVVDDTAVTPSYVQGLAADRELPIIGKIARGSLRNKLLIILPAALILSAISSALVEVILMIGGTYLCYEGAHKIHHALTHRGDDHAKDVPSPLKGPEAEKETVSGAIRTDFILSAEIMVIALKEVIEEPIVSRAIILFVVAVVITLLVYGVVGLIVKMDDIGLGLVKRGGSSEGLGRWLVGAMPVLLRWLSIIGTAAMLWVGGHIIIAGTHELGWDGLYDLVHAIVDPVHEIGGFFGSVLAWFADTGVSAIFGLAVGSLVVLVKGWLPSRSADHDTPAAAH